MAKLAFDIETSALPLENFDEVQQEYLLREAEKLTDEPARSTKREEILRQFNLWPFTAQVVCIGMLNADTQRGKVLFLAEDFEEDAVAAAPVEFLPCADEMELLTAFWDVAKHYDEIVTFNGRGFDVPFLYLRSAVLNVPISKKNWLGYRFATEPHCDLAEQFSFYNVSGREGAARNSSHDAPGRYGRGSHRSVDETRAGSFAGFDRRRHPGLRHSGGGVGDECCAHRRASCRPS